MMAEATILRLGYLGDGLAEGPLIVPGTLPGEMVQGEILDGRMQDVRIVTPSADRVRPPCSHAKSCGGCVVQHASDALVAGWKRSMVVDALRTQGLAAEIGAVETSPAGSRRRATFAGRRTRKGALVGFHGARSHMLVPVEECKVVTPALRSALPVLEALTVAGASRQGEIAFLVTETLNGLDVQATGGKPLSLALRQELSEIGAGAGLARLIWGDEIVAQWQLPAVQMGPARVTLPEGAFLQATREGEAALLAAVTEVVGPAARIVDLFSGCGTFALPLALQAEVHAVEGAPSQTAALLAAARSVPVLHPVTAEARDLFRRPLDQEALKSFEAAVIDPPRAGAQAQMQALAAAGVPRVASVSCNPATFARDAAILVAAGYRMGPVRVVDQFRWSPHVELMAGFFRE